MTFYEHPVVGALLSGGVFLIVVGTVAFLMGRPWKARKAKPRGQKRDRWPSYPTPEDWWR